MNPEADETVNCYHGRPILKLISKLILIFSGRSDRLDSEEKLCVFKTGIRVFNYNSCFVVYELSFSLAHKIGYTAVQQSSSPGLSVELLQIYLSILV